MTVKSKKKRQNIPVEADEVKRLTPMKEVLRSLYLLSGNNCAIPNCNNILINNTGTMIGRICHIEAAEKGGARFRKSMTNEDRRAASNLMLLCANHHVIIDDIKNVKNWPVTKLKQIKQNHEKIFSEVGDTLEKAAQEQFQDTTIQTPATTPKSLEKLLKTSEYQNLSDEQIAVLRNDIEKYVKKIQLVPEEERKFMLAIIQRSIRLNQQDSIHVDVNDVKGALNVPHTRIRRLCEAFERHRIGGITETGSGTTHDVFIRDPSDYLTWIDIDSFCQNEGLGLDRFVIKREFGLLD